MQSGSVSDHAGVQASRVIQINQATRLAGFRLALII